jgi:hypothetical protein
VGDRETDAVDSFDLALVKQLGKPIAHGGKELLEIGDLYQR